jgi:signal transduction histidine kinase/ActR/RegA family two-component response regulator
MLLVVNGVLWATLRQSIYGWFGLHAVAHVLAYWFALGLANQFGLSDWPRLANFCVTLSIVLFMASGIPFFQRLLQIKARHRWVQPIFWSQLTLPWLLIPAYFTDRLAEVMSLVLGTATLVAPCVLWISLSWAKQGRREAKWMLLGASISLAGLWWLGMSALGWHGLGTYSYIPPLLSSVGSLMAMQLALGTQVLQLRDDRRLSEQAATAAGRDAAIDRLARVEMAALLADKEALLAEHERAQDRLGKLVAALQQAQRLGQIGDWELDLASGAVVWSEALYGLFGLDPRQPPPRTNDWATLYTPASALRLQAAVVQTLATGEAYVIELERVLPDGRLRWTENRGVVQRDARGAILKLQGTCQDITDRREAEGAAAALLAEQTARRSKDEFLARVSHEMRTPLNAVLGFSQLLALDDQVKASPVLTEQVTMVIGAARFLTTMIDDVLDLARIQSGGLRLAAEITDVAAAASECVAWLSPLAQHHQVVLRLHGQPLAARVFGDRTRLRQVLINLVSNAIKYNHVGGSVDISISRLPARAADGDLPARSGRVEVAVRDTGSGLTPRQIAALFQPFNRLGAELSGIDGSGLGLALARELVEAMHGQLLVASQPGQGAVFTLQLPEAGADHDAGEAAVGDAGALATAGAPPQAVDDPIPQRDGIDSGPADMYLPLGRPFVVLYVEDNRLNVAVMRHAMKRLAGVQLEIAADGEAGLARARQLQPDLVLLDIGLPKLSGTEVMQRLRADPLLSAIPCVAVSANAMRGDIEQALAGGFSDYLVKPFTIDRLLGLVSDQMKRGAVRQPVALAAAPGVPPCPAPAPAEFLAAGAGKP